MKRLVNIDWNKILGEGILLQGIVTIIVFVACAILWVRGISLPNSLEFVVYTILGFVFGSTTSYFKNRKVEK